MYQYICVIKVRKSNTTYDDMRLYYFFHDESLKENIIILYIIVSSWYLDMYIKMSIYYNTYIICDMYTVALESIIYFIVLVTAPPLFSKYCGLICLIFS